MEIFKQVKIIDFVKYSKYALIVSCVLMIGSFALFVKPGFSLGIDFAGGSVMQIKYPEQAPIDDIRKILESQFKGILVSEFGSKEEVLLKIPFIAEIQNDTLSQMIVKNLAPTGEFEVRKFDSVGSKVGNELRQKGIMSLILAFLAMMVYVSFRYEWRFALAGILALVHDVVIAAACVIIFGIDLNLEVLAALLTLIGYCINNTIIIFDRIREKMLTDKTNDIALVMNEAVSNTLSRTLLTTLTVFFVVLTLYIFGGEIIVGFSLPMVVGVLCGVYTSTLVAPQLAILFRFDIQKYHHKEMLKEKRAQERKKIRQQYEGGRV